MISGGTRLPGGSHPFGATLDTTETAPTGGAGKAPLELAIPRGSGTSPSSATGWQRLITALLVVGPLAAVATAVPLLWGSVLHLRDVILAVVLYAVTGHGVTVGFHRMFNHRSFTPKRPLKIASASPGRWRSRAPS